jgi:hypothetical protein
MPGYDKTEAPIQHHETDRGAHREIEKTAQRQPLAGLFRRRERHIADGHGPIRFLEGWEHVSRHPGARIVRRKRWEGRSPTTRDTRRVRCQVEVWSNGRKSLQPAGLGSTTLMCTRHTSTLASIGWAGVQTRQRKGRETYQHSDARQEPG